jgi:hypothetical protein
MTMLTATSLTVVQIGLAIVLFFVVNWLGSHAVRAGYLQLSLFSKADEAPVFNFLFRVLAPVIYLFIVASVLYTLELDAWVIDLYRVTIYYVVFRWLFNVATERARLMNWLNQAAIAAFTIGLSYFAYDRIIRYRTNILPDLGTVANELWLAIALFLYTTINGIKVMPFAAERRRKAYIRHRINQFRGWFGDIIEAEAGSRNLEALAYSVLIYETFNRPTITRVLESRVLFPLGIGKTLGVMQVRTDKRISDEESVERGVKQLRRDFERAYSKALPRYRAQYLFAAPESETSEYAQYAARDAAEQMALRKYNIRSDYASEVMQVKDIIVSEFYPDLLPRDSDEDDDGLDT